MNRIRYAPRRTRGFTLIELMIAVGIVGILAGIAIPTYQDSVRKSRRGQAKADLIEATQAMERHYTVAGSYTSATLPFARSPQTGTAHYNLSFETAPSSSQFKIRAVPVGTQARDACGTLSVDYRGKKLPADSVCWQ